MTSSTDLLALQLMVASKTLRSCPFVNYYAFNDMLYTSHIRRLTSEHNSPMPVIDIAHQHLITARALQTSLKQEGKAVFDPLDWSAIVAASRVAAGLDGLDKKKVSAIDWYFRPPPSTCLHSTQVSSSRTEKLGCAQKRKCGEKRLSVQ